MITIALSILAFACFGLWHVLMCVYRMLSKGPTAADRILALDTIVINVIALLILYGVLAKAPRSTTKPPCWWRWLGFVSTVAYCRFVLRGDIIE